MIFIAGTKLMVKTGSSIKSFRDLAGKSVVVTTGTTNENTMRELATTLRKPSSDPATLAASK